MCRRIAVHAAGVVHRNRRIGFRTLRRVGVVLTDFSQRHADVGAAAWDIDAVGVGILEADADVFAQVGKTARIIAGFLAVVIKKLLLFLGYEMETGALLFFRRPYGYLQSTV